MENLLPPIRNAARAVILSQGNILLLRKNGYDDRGERFALPGGGQAPGETLSNALQRECVEEIGCEVQILDLIRVADYFKLRDTEPPSTRHLVEFLFRCEVPQDYVPRMGHHPDKHQVGVDWLPLAELHQRPLFPLSMIPVLQGLEGRGPLYAGTL